MISTLTQSDSVKIVDIARLVQRNSCQITAVVTLPPIDAHLTHTQCNVDKKHKIRKLWMKVCNQIIYKKTFGGVG